jgi:hypothetical protein
LLCNFLESVISLDSKSAEESKQIFRCHKYNCLDSSLLPKSCYFNNSSSQVTNPKLRKLLLIHGLFKLPCGFLLYSGASEGISFFSSLNISSMLFYFLFIPECHCTALPRLIWFLQELRSNFTIPIDDKPGLTWTNGWCRPYWDDRPRNWSNPS